MREEDEVLIRHGCMEAVGKIKDSPRGNGSCTDCHQLLKM